MRPKVALWYEIKKIWDVKILAAITVLCALYFIIFMSFTIDDYQQFSEDGGVGAMQIAFVHNLTKRFGPALEQEHIEDAQRHRDEIIAEVLKSMQLEDGTDGNATMFHNDGTQSIPLV